MHRTVLLILAFTLTACQQSPMVQHDGGGSEVKASATGPEGEVVVKREERIANEATVKPEPIQREPLKFDEVVHKGDRILFVGDDLTQQGFYNRAFATALLAMKPSFGLRFFNGGRDGATAASTLEWIDELLGMSKPTVVFLCLGINDGKNLPPDDARIQTYEDSLTKLIAKVKAYEGVREVIIMSAPASQTGDVEGGNKGGYNRTLFRMAMSAQGIAGINKVKFIDLFEPMRVVYTEAAKLGGDMLTHGGKLPTEDGHTVLASVMLWGIGVTREMLEPAGWSPLRPPHMGRVRGALGLVLEVPPFRSAVISRQVYEKMREHDVYFFQAWRLALPDRPSRDRTKLLEQGESSWFELDSYVKSVYKDADTTPASVPVPATNQSDASQAK
ncbi:MAG: GDSL-type esterase/lipase family protein [Phycisphaeraceae bacterium]